MRTINLSLFICLTVYISVGHGKSPEQIRGGTKTGDGDFPFVVALLINKESFCSGSIIDDRHILTAAHCVTTKDMAILTNILVKIGSSDFLNIDYENLYVAMVFVHEEWGRSDDPWANDIAILMLENTIRFSQYVQPIALPDKEINVPFDAFVTVVGFGSPSLDDSPRFQRKAELRLIHIESCIYIWTREIINRLKHFCTVGDENKSVSQGDSGGPLVYNNQLIGVVSSIGIGIPIRIFPDIFTRVDRYLSWIEKIIRRY